MMIKIKAKEGERLDQVIYRVQRTLANFEKIMRLNKHIIKKETLSHEDFVLFDDTIYKKEEKESLKSLWN